jgi:hypothetical protein
MQTTFKNFQEQLDYWFECFARMKPGNAIEIELTGKRDPQLFTDICKEYINQNHYDFEITNDYKYFKRINPF